MMTPLLQSSSFDQPCSYYINCLLRLHFISRAFFKQPVFVNKQMPANYKPKFYKH